MDTEKSRWELGFLTMYSYCNTKAKPIQLELRPSRGWLSEMENISRSVGDVFHYRFRLRVSAARRRKSGHLLDQRNSECARATCP